MAIEAQIDSYPDHKIDVATEYAIQDRIDGQIEDTDEAQQHRVLAYLESETI